MGPRGCLAAPFESMDATASAAKRTDLPIVWPVGGQVRKTVIECKLLRGSLERTLRDVLEWSFQVR